MASDNTVTVVGNVTRDPELRFTPSGQAVATFGLAVNRRWQNRQTNEWEEQVSFFDVTCWAQMAENVAESVQKGTRVRRHRSPRAALVGDRRRREALEGRDRRRRDRPEPALGHRQASRKNERRGGFDGGGGGGGGGGGAARPSPTSRPAGYGNDEEPF